MLIYVDDATYVPIDEVVAVDIVVSVVVVAVTVAAVSKKTKLSKHHKGKQVASYQCSHMFQ